MDVVVYTGLWDMIFDVIGSLFGSLGRISILGVSILGFSILFVLVRLLLGFIKGKK